MKNVIGAFTTVKEALLKIIKPKIVGFEAVESQRRSIQAVGATTKGLLLLAE